jgi:hypothetical protein
MSPQPTERTPTGAVSAWAPGWYPDADHEGDERYWDGENWTGRRLKGGGPNQETADPRNNWLVWTGCVVGFFLWFVGLIIAIVLFRRRDPRAKYVLVAAIAGALITPIAIITSIVG